MAIPSRVLGSGISPLSTVNVCGDGAAVIAAGASAGAATQVNAVFNNISTAPSSTGVKLPKCENGAFVTIYNAGANTATVYPTTGDTINGGASVTIATTKARVFWGTSATTWFSMLGA